MKRVLVTVVALLSLVARAAGPAQLSDALDRLQSGDAAGAVSLLESLARAEPRDARIWRALGQARHLLHDEDASIGAYERALEFESDSPQVWFALGAAYAAKREPLRALAWLERARASHRIDMSQITADEAFAPLRS